MTRRPAIPSDIVADVLTASRRRCCVCFALQKDANEKRGQIAHLDHDPGNNSTENLAFLCFDHHDQYDSRTSQSKGLTLTEVKRYRSELLAFLARSNPAPGEPSPDSGASDSSSRASRSRSSDRRLVFTNFVLPVHQSVQELHRSYVEGFHNILRHLEEDGVTADLRRWIALECDRKAAERAGLVGEYTSIRDLAARELDVALPEVDAYLGAIRKYLLANGICERLMHTSRVLRAEDAYITGVQLRRALRSFKATGLSLASPEFAECLAAYAVAESDAEAVADPHENEDALLDPEIEEVYMQLEAYGLIGFENPAYNRVRLRLTQDKDRVVALIHELRDELQRAYLPVNIAFGMVKSQLLA